MRVFFSFYYTNYKDEITTLMEWWSKEKGFSFTPFISDEKIEEMKVVGLPMIHQWIDEEIAKSDLVIILAQPDIIGRYFIEYEIESAIKQNKPIIGLTIDENYTHQDKRYKCFPMSHFETPQKLIEQLDLHQHEK